MRGRSRLSAARPADAGKFRGSVRGGQTDRRPRPHCRPHPLVARAARPRAQFLGRARAHREPDARSRAEPPAGSARAGGGRRRLRAAGARGNRRRRLGYRQRSGTRPRLADARLGPERRWLHPGQQPHRLRRRMGARPFRQAAARNRGGALRRRGRACRPQRRAHFAHRRRDPRVPRDARLADAARGPAQEHRGRAALSRLRAGALQSRHHQRARRYAGATRAGAIGVAGRAVDRPDRCRALCDRGSPRRLPRNSRQGATHAGSASGSAGAHPAGPADRAVAPAAGRRRGRTPARRAPPR